MVLLDSNLFTLTFDRRSNEPNVVDLVPFSSQSLYDTNVANQAASTATTSKCTPLYTFSRAIAGHYSIQLIDSLTQIVLASVECPSSSDKSKTIQLYNPDVGILLEKKGNTFRQEWRWSWQGNEFSIRRDGRSYIVEVSRRPDPEIDIARYTAAASKTRKPFLQLLDYNVQRLEIEDRRGLEILAIVACLQCIDQEYDEKHRDASANIYSSASTMSWSKQSSSSSISPAPSVPSSIAKAHAVNTRATLERNEMMIDLHVGDNAYIDQAINLLRQDEQGEGLQVVIIRAEMAATTLRAVRIAASIKARWYKLSPMAKGRTLDPMPGSTSEIAEELYQYVRDPAVQSSAAAALDRRSSDATVGPRGRIKLDSPTGNEQRSGAAKRKDKAPFSIQSPPERLTIYLSKDRIDEFERVGHTVVEPFGQSSKPSAASSTPSPRPPPNRPPKTEVTQADVSGMLRKFKKWGNKPSG